MYSGVSTVATQTFSGIAQPVYLILGVVVAFFVLEIIIDRAQEARLDKEIALTIKNSKDLRESI